MARTFLKDPDATLDYAVDWSAWLAGDTLSASEWIVPEDLTQDGETHTDTVATVVLSGGEAGRTYRITNRITTAGGRVTDETIYVLVVDSDALVVSLGGVKAHLKVDSSDEDSLLVNLIRVAEDVIERKSNRTLRPRTRTAHFGGWPARGEWLRLPYPPIVGVTEVRYVDADGAEQVLDPSVYLVLTDEDQAAPARVYLGSGQAWPAVLSGHPKPIAVEYVAGYEDVTDVPDCLRQAMLLQIGHLYEQREATSDRPVHEVPGTVEALVALARVGSWVL